jgi:CO/xanthine dehydrogenase Mo-binding subunit
MVQGDTDQATYDHGIGGSRGAHTIGRVAQMAASRAREELFREAAKKLKKESSALDTLGGWVYVKTNPENRVSFAELSYDRHIKEGGPVIGTAHLLPEMDEIDPGRVKGLSFTAFKGVTIGCHAALVEVCPATGRVEIKKYVAGHDVGRAINPRAVEGQIEGGVSMELGFALTEALRIGKKGEVENPGFHDYKLLTSLDLPETEPLIFEVPARCGPYGAKGLGEPTMAPPAAVIGNAIYDAVGVRMRHTPMLPEDIYREIQSAEERKPRR